MSDTRSRTPTAKDGESPRTPPGLFVRQVVAELRKVVWPTRQEAMRLTWVVIAVVIIISLILAGFDAVIQVAIKWLLRQ